MMCYLGRSESSVLKTSLTQSTLGLDECIPTVLPLDCLVKPISIFHNKNLVYFRAANPQEVQYWRTPLRPTQVIYHILIFYVTFLRVRVFIY